MIVTNAVLMTDSRSPKCWMHETKVEGVICCWNKMKLKSVVCRGFQHDKSLPRFLFMLRIYILWWIVKQKSTSYRVNEMFLSCTSFMKMSICGWFYKTISPDMILCIKECNKKCQHIYYIKISITLFGILTNFIQNWKDEK